MLTERRTKLESCEVWVNCWAALRRVKEGLWNQGENFQVFKLS